MKGACPVRTGRRAPPSTSSLPPRQRQVLAWHYDGYSNIEIAKILGLTDKAVAANLYQARQALKRLLAGSGEDGATGGGGSERDRA
jgi:DNA-directed RNA polymerase specialized sigma24 family protein